MATNITSTQLSVAANAFLTQCLTGRPPSPIGVSCSGSSVIRDASTSLTVTSSVSSQQLPRTEELILAELQKLSSQMTQVEQELQAETFISIPRKCTKIRAGGHTEDSSLIATGYRTDIDTSLDESVSISRCPGGVRIPVHTHLNTTTTMTVASLFAQGGQKQSTYSCKHQSPKLHSNCFFHLSGSSRTDHANGPVTLVGIQGPSQGTADPQGIRLVSAQASGPTVPQRMPTAMSAHSVTFNLVITSATYFGHSITGLHQQPQVSHLTQQTLIPPVSGVPMMSQHHYQLENIAEQNTVTPSANHDQPIISSIQALHTTGSELQYNRDCNSSTNMLFHSIQVICFVIIQYIIRSHQQQVNSKPRRRKLSCFGPRTVPLWET